MRTQLQKWPFWKLTTRGKFGNFIGRFAKFRIREGKELKLKREIEKNEKLRVEFKK